MSTAIDTPIVAIGRRLADADRRREMHDQAGLRARDDRDLYAHHQRMLTAAVTEQEGLWRYACELHAETSTDALVQRDAAITLADFIEACDVGLEGEPLEDVRRNLRAMSSVARVLAAIPGAVVPGVLLDNCKLRERDETMPPVRLSEGLA